MTIIFIVIMALTAGTVVQANTNIPIVGVEGWQLFCPTYIGAMTSLTADLPDVCMATCIKTNECRWITVDRNSSQCWMMARETECVITPNLNYISLAPSYKTFDRREGVAFPGNDITAYQDIIVRGPFSFATASTCKKLCQIHPKCNTAAVDRNTGRCYLKVYPLDALGKGGQPNADVISFLPN